MFRTFSMIAILAIGFACAQTPQAEKPWTVSTYPAWLFAPFPNLGVEYRPSPELGFAVYGGFLVGEDPYHNLRAELRNYPRRSGPHALLLGVEALWVRIENSGQGFENIQHLLGLGPILGYRYEHRSGFTASLHAGPAVFIDKSTGADWEVFPWFLVGIDAGWSF